MLYKIGTNGILEGISEKKCLEKDIQKIVGENLGQLLGLTFVDFEFSIENVRIDILAFDAELNAPVIIELKKDNSKSLFDQGMEYFHILSNRKADFCLKLHESIKIPADTSKVNWEASRVIFIGKNFSQRQKRAIDFNGIPIELWDYDLYSNNTFQLQPISLKKKAKIEFLDSKKTSSPVQKITKEFKEYSLDSQRQWVGEETWSLYDRLESEILSWDGVQQKILKHYVNFSVNGNHICSVRIDKKKLRVIFGNKKDNIQYISPRVRDVSSIGTVGVGDYEIDAYNFDEVDEAALNLKQKYKIS